MFQSLKDRKFLLLLLFLIFWDFVCFFSVTLRICATLPFQGQNAILFRGELVATIMPLLDHNHSLLNGVLGHKAWEEDDLQCSSAAHTFPFSDLSPSSLSGLHSSLQRISLIRNDRTLRHQLQILPAAAKSPPVVFDSFATS